VNQIETDSGLRYRLRRAARQVGEQHRHIAEIYIALGNAVASRTKQDAAEALRRYEEAIHAHFSLEEEVFFPAIHGIETTQDGEVGNLANTHDELRVELRSLVDALSDADPEIFSDSLHRFAKHLAIHESHEEGLLERINAIAPPASNESDTQPTEDPTP
jgi:hemerythrin